MSETTQMESNSSKNNGTAVKFVCFKSTKITSQFQNLQESEQGNQSVKRRSRTKYENMLNLGKRRYCNCTKTQCDKNYCDCFANGESCDQKVCKCVDCLNQKNSSVKSGNKFSCNCKKTSCVKGYCECFSSGKKCGFFCSCVNCRNKEEKVYIENNYEKNEMLKVVEIGINRIIIDNYKLQFRWALKTKKQES